MKRRFSATAPKLTPITVMASALPSRTSRLDLVIVQASFRFVALLGLATGRSELTGL
jgi:hypothetical protein